MDVNNLFRKNSIILLVEDNPDDVELTLRAFRKYNFTNDIIVANDGEEALEIIFERANNKKLKPDLILLDISLPKVNGIEVLRQIKTNDITKTIPVIILTSSNEEKDLVESYNYGANSYIRKPVDFKMFIDVVKEIGLYWLLLNNPPVK
ncbi:MAG: response regulator [Bacteroidales bacterium]|nr:response regulator [Bacteroidales bacterium]